MQIVNWMSRLPVCVSPDDTLAKARTLMDHGRFRRLPVVLGDKLVGIITDRDLRQHSGLLDSIKVNAAMTPNPVTVSPRNSAEEAAELMLQHKVGGLPVVDNGKVVGIMSATDLIRALLSVIQGVEQILDE
ncbi:MAG: CBS domain-containing protein [Candidatus Binataceae bacterium]